MKEVAADELQAEENLVSRHGSRDDDKVSGVGPTYVSRLRIHLPLRDTKDTVAVPAGGVGGGGWQDVARRGARESGDVVGNKGLLVGMMSRSRLLCLVMMLDLMTMSVQIPSLPSAFEGHGMDLRWQGWVMSVHGIISFFVAPLLGGVSDSVGRVTMLQVSAVGSLSGAVGSLYATGKWSFIAARTLPGLLKCSLPISQAYIVDVSEGAAERSKNLGMLGASFGLAFVLGSPLGGVAADYNASGPFLLAACLSLLLLGVVSSCLPEPVTKKSKPNPVEGEVSVSGRGDLVDKSKSRLSLFRGPGGRRMAWSFHDRFWVVIAEGLYHTSLAPMLTKVLGFPAARIGLLLSFTGLVATLTNAFLVGALSRRFSGRKIMVMALLVLGTGWIMLSVGASTPSVLAALAVAGVGGNVFQTINKAAVSQHAPPELVGTIMGMSGAMETFGRILAGPLSGYLFHSWGPRHLPLGCAGAAFYVACALTLRGATASIESDVVAAAAGHGSGTSDLKSD